MYKPIDIERNKFAPQGVAFPDLETLDSAAGAIDPNM
jgi:hypothetical protein